MQVSDLLQGWLTCSFLGKELVVLVGRPRHVVTTQDHHILDCRIVDVVLGCHCHVKRCQPAFASRVLELGSASIVKY